MPIRFRSILPVAVLAVAAAAQSTQRPVSFEVASVRARGTAPVIGPNRIKEEDSRAKYIGVQVFLLLLRAYDLQAYQVIGPAWIKEEHYDIEATLPSGTTKADIPLMLQQLLAERFRLVLHRELREMPVYAITVGKDGPKLSQCEFSPADQPGTGGTFNLGEITNRQKPLPGMCPANRSLSNKEVSILVEANTVADLARYMQAGSDRPVVDRTGLQGHYSIVLEGAQIRDIPPDDAARLPSLFNEIQKLGLRLEARREKIQYLVVDSGNKVPTDN